MHFRIAVPQLSDMPRAGRHTGAPSDSISSQRLPKRPGRISARSMYKVNQHLGTRSVSERAELLLEKGGGSDRCP